MISVRVGIERRTVVAVAIAIVWLLFIQSLEDRFLFSLVNLLWLSNELILPIIDSPDASLEIINQATHDLLKLPSLEEPVLILSQDHQFPCDLMQGDDFFSLQFCNIVQHLIFLDLEVVLLEGSHDVGVGVDSSLPVILSVSVPGQEAASPSIDIHLDLLLHLLDLHDFRLQGSVLLHVVLIDTV